MEKDKSRQRGFPPNVIRVCIDHYDGELKGRIFSKMNAVPLQFENCCEMLIRTDEMFDKCGYPQSFKNKKNFQGSQVVGQYIPPQSMMEDEDIFRQKGEIRTLDIYVKSRRNAGWQGSILYENGLPPEPFHSEKELLQCVLRGISSEQGRDAPPGNGESPPGDLVKNNNY